MVMEVRSVILTTPMLLVCENKSFGESVHMCRLMSEPLLLADEGSEILTHNFKACKEKQEHQHMNEILVLLALLRN